MTRRIPVTLCSVEIKPFGPPISVLTHPGCNKTAVIPVDSRSIAKLFTTIFIAALLDHKHNYRLVGYLQHCPSYW